VTKVREHARYACTSLSARALRAIPKQALRLIIAVYVLAWTKKN